MLQALPLSQLWETEEAPETLKFSDKVAKTSWWQLSEEEFSSTPRGNEVSKDCMSWARIRTPSPEYRYTSRGSSGLYPLQYPELPPAVQQPCASYPEATTAPDVVAREPADSESPSGSAHQLQLRQVLSIGSVGHPYNCGLPCKYSRGSRVCKEAAACLRCHLCLWKRSDERARTAEKRARVRTAEAEPTEQAEQTETSE